MEAILSQLSPVVRKRFLISLISCQLLTMELPAQEVRMRVERPGTVSIDVALVDADAFGYGTFQNHSQKGSRHD